MLYPIVRVDGVGRRIRVRGREYPAAAIRRATRSVSSSASASYLTYRFTLDDGRRFRVIAAGRPFRGLAPGGLRALSGIVEASGIAEPAGLSPSQQRISSALQANRRAAPIGRSAILRDVAELLGEAAPAPGPEPAGAPPPQDIGAIAAEDLAADELLARELGGLRRLRRMSGWLGVLGALTLVGLLIVLVIDERAGILGWSQEHPSATVAATVGFLALIVGGSAWAVFADAWVRGARRRADAWWASADETARGRGLPSLYLVADASGARRWITTLAFASTATGLIAAISVVLVFFVEGGPIALPFALAATAGSVVAAIVCWRRSGRDARESAERVALRGGLRLDGGQGA